MKIYQQILDEKFGDYFSLENIAPKIIIRKLESEGVELSDEQKQHIKSEIERGKLEDLKLSLDPEKVPADMVSLDPSGNRGITINLDESGLFIKELAEHLENRLSDIIEKIVEYTGNNITKRLRATQRKMLKKRRRDNNGYENQLFSKWHPALDLLETMIVIANEVGAHYNYEFRDSSQVGKENTIEVITRLHARACQIASEILVLLKSGFADGAHARWRSLHEVVVIQFFIHSGGEELAQKYLQHDIIESYKAATIYQRYYEDLGYEPLSNTEFNIMKTEYDNLLQKYGKNFAKQYGWAADTIGNKNPSFRDIEEYVDMAHNRPFYKMASNNIHANAKGVFLNLGIYPEGPDLLLTGPSFLGLVDAGQGTAISIYQSTVALSVEPILDHLIICDILRRFMEDTEKAFINCNKKIEKEYRGG